MIGRYTPMSGVNSNVLGTQRFSDFHYKKTHLKIDRTFGRAIRLRQLQRVCFNFIASSVVRYLKLERR